MKLFVWNIDKHKMLQLIKFTVRDAIVSNATNGNEFVRVLHSYISIESSEISSWLYHKNKKKHFIWMCVWLLVGIHADPHTWLHRHKTWKISFLILKIFFNSNFLCMKKQIGCSINVHVFFSSRHHLKVYYWTFLAM